MLSYIFSSYLFFWRKEHIAEILDDSAVCDNTGKYLWESTLYFILPSYWRVWSASLTYLLTTFERLKIHPLRKGLTKHHSLFTLHIGVNVSFWYCSYYQNMRDCDQATSSYSSSLSAPYIVWLGLTRSWQVEDTHLRLSPYEKDQNEPLCIWETCPVVDSWTKLFLIIGWMKVPQNIRTAHWHPYADLWHKNALGSTAAL